MPVLWTKGVTTGRLTMNEFVAVTSTNIAKILNCYPQKGAIMVGADADLVVWDPKRKKTITAAKPAVGDRLQRLRGLRGHGLPRFVLTRGKVAVVENEIKSRAGPRPVRRPRAEERRQPRALDAGRKSPPRARSSAPAFRRRGCDGTCERSLPRIARGLGSRGSVRAVRHRVMSPVATPALADAVLPIGGVFGNASGCTFFMTGRGAGDDLMLLTPDTFTAAQPHAISRRSSSETARRASPSSASCSGRATPVATATRSM